MQVSRVLKTLAWIAPQAAMRRARAMALLQAQSRYAGATTGRRGASFLGGQQSANTAIGGKIQLLRARAHEMVRDHWAFTSTSSRSASIGASIRSTRSAHCSESPAGPQRQPSAGSTRENGPTLHLVGVGNNRIGKGLRFYYISYVDS